MKFQNKLKLRIISAFLGLSTLGFSVGVLAEGHETVSIDDIVNSEEGRQRAMMLQEKGISQVSPAAAASEAATNEAASAAAEATQAAVDSCLLAEKKSFTSCNTMSSFGMPPAAAALTQAGMAALPSLIAQMGSSSNPAKQCSLQKTLNTTMAGISAAKNAQCVFTIVSCTRTCETAVAELVANPIPHSKALIAEAKRKIASCNTNYAAAAAMLSQTLLLGVNALAAGKCAKESTIAAIPYPSPPPFQIPQNVAGCDNPAFAATSPICVCQKDPTNKMCAGTQQDWQTGGGGGTTNAGGITAPESLDLSDLGDGTAVDQTKLEGKTSGPGKDPDGGGGGGPSGGGSGSGVAGMGGDGSGAALAPPTVITGQSSSSGGGNSLIGGSTGGGSGRGTASRDDDDSALIRGLIPRGGYANRATAGMTIPSVDGTTGPMGPTLFEKVSGNYQYQDTKLPFQK